MDLLIVNAGLEAAHNAGLAGPRVNAITAKFGDGTTTPAVGMTDIQGTLLHTAAVTSFSVISANLIEYRIELDVSIGDFTFTEVGLFLDSSELFAIGLPAVPIIKLAQALPAVIGNTLTVKLQVQLSNITNVLDFTLVSSGLLDEWAGNTLSAAFVSTTSFTLPGDQTQEYHAGRRVRLFLIGTQVYSHIETSVYSSGPDTTTITVTDPVVAADLSSADHASLSAGSIMSLPSTLMGDARTIPSGSSPGIPGQKAYDANFEYTCVATDTWKRSAISSF